MKKYNKVIIVATVIFLMILTVLVQATGNNVVEPGSSDDPIVTFSYVELRIEQLKAYIDQKLSAHSPSQSQQEDGSNPSFQVVELKAGQRLLGGEGTEVILRGGNAIAIDSHLGGLSDVTGAKDIRKDEKIPPNHLLIVPRNDGRGLRAITDAIFLVRGSYIIN